MLHERLFIGDVMSLNANIFSTWDDGDSSDDSGEPGRASTGGHKEYDLGRSTLNLFLFIEPLDRSKSLLGRPKPKAS